MRLSSEVLMARWPGVEQPCISSATNRRIKNLEMFAFMVACVKPPNRYSASYLTPNPSGTVPFASMMKASRTEPGAGMV